jgi:hypothetical protein
MLVHQGYYLQAEEKFDGFYPIVEFNLQAIPSIIKIFEDACNLCKCNTSISTILL